MLYKDEFPDVEFDKTEKWFEAEYAANDYPDAWIELWDSEDIIDDLYIPALNQFVAMDLTVLDKPETEVVS